MSKPTLRFLVLIGAITSACGGGTPPRPPTNAEMVALITSQEQSITVSGKILNIGDSADDVFSKLQPLTSARQDTTEWSVTHVYSAHGGFALTFARKPDPGPYRLVRISTRPRDTSTSLVDCTDLGISLTKTRPDLNFIERAEIIKDAKEMGECRKIY